MEYVIIGVLGAAMGSFVHALVWRLHQTEKRQPRKGNREFSILHGRSMCSNCKHVLASKDLIPIVSWVVLGGKCRYCHKPIADSPFVELFMAVLFILSYAVWPRPLSGIVLVGLVAWLMLCVKLVALAVYDLKYMLLPNKLVACAGVIVGIYTVIVSIQHPSYMVDTLIGLLAFGGLFWGIFQVSKGRWIGGGDVKLGFVLGAWLADWRLSLLAIFVASLTGTFLASIGLITKKISLKSKIPFGPLLILGTIIATLVGKQLLGWYFRVALGV